MSVRMEQFDHLAPDGSPVNPLTRLIAAVRAYFVVPPEWLDEADNVVMDDLYPRERPDRMVA